MGKRGLSAKSWEHLKADKNRVVVVAAGPPGGLYGCIHPSGKRVWVLRYRFGKKTRKMTLKSSAGLGLAEARKRAVLALADLDQGFDPAKKAPEGSDGVEAVLTKWLAGEVAALDTAHEIKRIALREIAEPWKHLRVSEVTRPHVVELLHGIQERGKGATANKVHSILKTFFLWAVAEEAYNITSSPVATVKRPVKEVSRDRWLRDVEIAEVWRAAKALPSPHGPYLQALILTAQREGEVASMRWGDVDLHEAVWTLAGKDTKTGATNIVALSTVAVEVLRKVPRGVAGDHVFTHNGGESPLTTFDALKKSVDANLEARGVKLEHWTIHDLRRTCRTYWGRTGVPEHIGEMNLNHSTASRSKISKIYNRYNYAVERRAAMESWSQHLLKLESMPVVTVGQAAAS